MTFSDFLRTIRAVVVISDNINLQGGTLDTAANEGNATKALRTLQALRSNMEHGLKKVNALIAELDPEINDSDKLASELKDGG